MSPQDLEFIAQEILAVAESECPACHGGDCPVRDDDGRWWHERREDRECDAASLHTALRNIIERTSRGVPPTEGHPNG